MIILLVIYFFLSTPVMAQTYLPSPTLNDAITRSAKAWDAIKCDPQPDCDKQQVTKYAWPIRPLTDGSAAIELPPGVTSVSNGRGDKVHSLTPGEIAALKTRAGLADLLPDILKSADFLARIPANKKTAIVNYVTSRPALLTMWNKMQSGTVDFQDAQVVAFLDNLQNNGVMTALERQVLTQPVAVAPAP